VGNQAAEHVFGEELDDGSGEIDRVLEDVRRLRGAIVDAWQQRGLTMDKAERRRLRDEIQATCDMLKTLTAND